MDNYYVNDRAQSPGGEREVHTDTCPYFPKIVSKTALGAHQTCHPAIIKAREFYSNVDGCAECCPDCHTR